LDCLHTTSAFPALQVSEQLAAANGRISGLEAQCADLMVRRAPLPQERTQCSPEGHSCFPNSTKKSHCAGYCTCPPDCCGGRGNDQDGPVDRGGAAGHRRKAGADSDAPLCTPFPCTAVCSINTHKQQRFMGPLSVARRPALSTRTNSNALMCPLFVARRPARRAHKSACACASDEPRCFSTCLCLAHVLAMLRLCCSMGVWLGPLCHMSLVAVSRAGACRRRGRWRTFGRGSAGCGQQPSAPAWLPRTSCLQLTPPCMRCGSRWPIGRRSTLNLGLGCCFM
jgi:hypothetical protein